jgi:hypothetical protein
MSDSTSPPVKSNKVNYSDVDSCVIPPASNPQLLGRLFVRYSALSLILNYSDVVSCVIPPVSNPQLLGRCFVRYSALSLILKMSE